MLYGGYVDIKYVREVKVMCIVVHFLFKLVFDFNFMN
jgi:hypothetical protein